MSKSMPVMESNFNDPSTEKFDTNCWPPMFRVDEIQRILGFHGPPTSTARGLCGFNIGWSQVVKSRVKSLATSCVTKLD